MSEIVYQSDAMRHLLEQANRYAQTSATVLIQGESGTGKELIASYLHQQSSRCRQPFIPVNCSGFSEQLVDSALFGHERGAFTGADRQRLGCFEAAGKGTLFLDEVGELSASAQARLLRVLEQREFHRVGSFESIPCHARVIAATNRDLETEVRENRFREDLFYRLETLKLLVPPLRERADDIRVLAKHFLGELQSDDCGLRGVVGFSQAALQDLQEHHWPGNARQLRNVVHRAYLAADSPYIESVGDDQPQILQLPRASLPDFLNGLSIREIENLVIAQRLEFCNGNRTQAAQSLGITTKTLRAKLDVEDRPRNAA